MTEGRPRVLVIEDEAIVALDLEVRLREAGFEVVGHAPDPARALALAELGPIDVVLADVKLRRGADGLAAAADVRARTGAAIVIFSAFGDEATRQRAESIGATDYLVKPIADAALLRAVRAAAEASRAPVRGD